MFERYNENVGFIKPPLFPSNCFLNEDGCVVNKNMQPLSFVKNNDGKLMIEIDWKDGVKEYEVALLVAFTFKTPKIDVKFWDSLSVDYYDGNKENLHPSNLVWRYPEALGSNIYNGFAFIPMFSRYMINREGVVFELRSMKMMTAHYNKGYYSYSLLPDIGPRTSLKRHRGICLAFTRYPVNVDDMQVNHKNGIPGDDRLDNLEWVNGSENRLHAIDMGLTNINKPVIVRNIKLGKVTRFNTVREFCKRFNVRKNVVTKYLSNRSSLSEPLIIDDFEIEYENPAHSTVEKTNKCSILVRDVLTKEIKEYDSIVSCAESLGVSKHVVNWRINSPTSNLYPDYKQLKRKTDKTPWYVPIDPEKELLDYSWSKKVCVRFADTGAIVEYNTQRDAAKELEISESTITTWLAKPNQSFFRLNSNGRLVQVKNKSDRSGWRISSDPENEYKNSLCSKVVLVKNIVTGVVDEYSSCVECAHALGITTTNLNWRLKSKGRKVYEKKFLFKYKNDSDDFIELANSLK